MLAVETKLNLLRTMVRPLLRFCLRSAVSLQELLEVIKIVFVELAEEEIRLKQQKATASRVSVMTGVHRRDVTRILQQGPKTAGGQPLLTRIVARWNHDARFLTKNKKPRLLTYKGEDSEFSKLVALVSKDIGPAAILFQLERLGLVERSGDRIKVIADTFHVHENPEQGMVLLSQDAHTLTTAVEENLFNPRETRNLHLRTDYDNIRQNAIPTIRKWLIQRGAAFHREARSYIAQFDLDVNPKPQEVGKGRVVVTSFSWTSNVEPDNS